MEHTQLNLFAPVTFVLAALCTCWETRTLTDIMREAAVLLFPKGYILDRVMEYRPAWKPRVLEWIDKNASCVVSVEEAVEQYKDLYPLYIKHCTEKIIVKIDHHIGKNFEGDESMKEGWATTVFIESCFGVADQMLIAAQGSSLASLLGPLLGVQSGFFSTPSGRLRQHLDRQEKSHGSKLTDEEKAQYLLKTPLIAAELLPEALRKAAHRASRKRAIPLYRLKKGEIIAAEEENLKNKEGEAKAKERADARALKLYQNSINFPVYTTMTELKKVLNEKHSDGKAKFSATMKCEIIVKQLQYRRDCYNRTLRIGSMHSSHSGGSESKLAKLLESFKQVLVDEKETPALLKPPQIRTVYQPHAFATQLRANLDKERNDLTRELTKAFMEQYDGGVFTGWRATRDYNLARPLNPKVLEGAPLANIFEDPKTEKEREYDGHIFKYVKSSKWWRVKWNDGEVNDMTYWDLAACSTPPDLDLLSYDNPAAVAMNFLEASEGSAKYTKGEKTFEMEGEVCVFVSVLFVSATGPFVGACAGLEDFKEPYREDSYEDLTENALVHMTPMPVIKKWLAASEAFGPGA